MNDHVLTPFRKLLRTAILFACLTTAFMGAMRSMGHGYQPSDDALRHVAKVVSGRDWQDILVVRPDITVDSHPGWHATLDFVARFTGDDGGALLFFSVTALFLCVILPATFFFKRPEAWIGAWLFMTLFAFGRVARLFFGRPFIVSVCLMLVFCALWEHVRDREKPYGTCAVYAVLTALSVWIHGTWYLLALPLLALLVCAQWRVAWWMAVATALGVLLGAVLTGDPVAFIRQMLYHAISAFGKHDVQRQLVGEFRPFAGDPMLLVVTGMVLLWRNVRKERDTECARDPVLVLALLGWVGGFFAGRFWYDWGWPALLFWVAREIERVMEGRIEWHSLRRTVLTGVLCLCFYLSLSNDTGGRWSTVLLKMPDMENPEHRPWLPDEGGIVYNDSMHLFYHLFFDNPHGPWRYVLGFEPVWMPNDDLEIYRNIQLKHGTPESYAPWVAKMTEKDRMILRRSSQPEIEGLEWHEITSHFWSGRLAPHEPDTTEETDDGFDAQFL